jgi:hypothetical protein
MVGSDVYRLRRELDQYWEFHSVPRGTVHLTSTTSCTCEDHKFRHRTCKHMRIVQEELEP